MATRAPSELTKQQLVVRYFIHFVTDGTLKEIIAKGDLVHLVAGGPLHQPRRGGGRLLLPSN